MLTPNERELLQMAVAGYDHQIRTLMVQRQRAYDRLTDPNPAENEDEPIPIPTPPKRRPSGHGKHRLSPAGRRRIIAAARRRWKRQRAAAANPPPRQTANSKRRVAKSR